MKKIQFIFFIIMSLIISKWAVADSRFGEAEHLEDLFKDGIEAENEEEAERLVEAKVKELMYGGPYYTVTDEEDE